MWTYDLAREQTPTYEHLRRLLETTREGGYNAFGLYMEHRFAYPSTPWAHGQGAVTPEMVGTLERDFKDIQIVPFLNLLGHSEGLLYTERGRRYREETLMGMQACPSCPDFVTLAQNLVGDMLNIFSSKLIHIGGDETLQLGQCPRCAARVAASESLDGKALLYGEHFGPLARRVVDAGRTPAVWGDMFLDHPQALDSMPKETLIFDWQYFSSPLDTSRKFIQGGFEVICCPSIQTYNSVWCHLSESEQNVREAVSAAYELDAVGVCVTTWESGLFGNYETILPAIVGAGRILGEGGDEGNGVDRGDGGEVATSTGNTLPIVMRDAYFPGDISLEDAMDGIRAQEPRSNAFLANYASQSAEYGRWAQLMGVDLPELGGLFGHSQTRSSLKCRLLLYANPFLAWLHHHEELTGEIGTQALTILDHAMSVAQTQAERGVTQLVVKAIEFVRYADQARQAYAQELPGVAIASLAPCRQIFEDLEKIAGATQINIGGSLADAPRCRAAREAVERSIRRIKQYGDGSLGYLPAFEVLTHPNFIPHDQACWWLINGWARE